MSDQLETLLTAHMGACQTTACLTELLHADMEELLELIEPQGHGTHELFIAISGLAILANAHLGVLWDIEERNYYDDMTLVAERFTRSMRSGSSLPETAVQLAFAWAVIWEGGDRE